MSLNCLLSFFSVLFHKNHTLYMLEQLCFFCTSRNLAGCLFPIDLLTMLHLHSHYFPWLSSKSLIYFTVVPFNLTVCASSQMRKQDDHQDYKTNRKKVQLLKLNIQQNSIECVIVPSIYYSTDHIYNSRIFYEYIVCFCTQSIVPTVFFMSVQSQEEGRVEKKKPQGIILMKINDFGTLLVCQ